MSLHVIHQSPSITCLYATLRVVAGEVLRGEVLGGEGLGGEVLGGGDVLAAGTPECACVHVRTYVGLHVHVQERASEQMCAHVLVREYVRA